MWEDCLNMDLKKIEEIRSRLKKMILDQESAVDILLDTFLISTNLVHTNLSGPLLFLLLGDQKPQALYFAQQVSRGFEYDFKIYHMSEYQSEDDVFELQFRKNDEGNLVPAVVVFSNIEDAHKNIQRQVAKLFSENVYGNSIFFFTSTLGNSILFRGEVQPIKTSSLVGYLNLVCDLLLPLRTDLNGEEINIFSSSFLDLLSSMATIIILNPLEDNTLFKYSLEYFSTQIELFEKKINCNIRSTHFYEFSSLLFLSFAPFYDLNRIFDKISHDLLRVIIHEKSLNEFRMISLEVGELALVYLKHAQKDLKFFMTQVSRQQNLIELKWSLSYQSDILCISIIDVVTSHSTYSFIKSFEFPQVEYSVISFATVAGHNTVKSALLLYIDLLRKTSLFKEFKTDVPKGLILYGSQGVGKSSLAQAFCFEAKNPFVKLSGLDLYNQDLVYRTYLKALESSPCLVILENIDVKLAGPLGVPSLPINFIVRCIKLTNIFTIVTTRSLEDIPFEFLAPGLFDILVEVNEIDKDARKYFVDKINELPHDLSINYDYVASLITGMSSQELQRIVPQAVLSTVFQKSNIITESILVEQINKIKYGERMELKRLRNPQDEMVLAAYHEAGHAVISCALLPQLPIEQVTVSPRSDVLGFVSYKNEDFISTATKDEIFKNICILLAGRTVKAKKFGSNSIDSGDIADLGQATYEAFVAIAHLGMDEQLGYINIQFIEENNSSGFLKEKIENRFLHWLDKAKKETEFLVEKHWFVIAHVADILIQRQVLSGDELLKIIEDIQEL